MTENKRDEFSRKKNMKIQSGCETMRKAASKEQGENEGAVKNKSEHEHRRQNIGSADTIIPP